MAAIGSLIFCTDCGNLLPVSKGSENNILLCECCGAENQGQSVRQSVTHPPPSVSWTAHQRQSTKPTLLSTDVDVCSRSRRRKTKPDRVWKTVTTRTKPSDFPSLLRQKLSTTQTVNRHEVQTERVDATVECPACGKKGIRYSEMQQRGADEGSTIFYNCDCGERYADLKRLWRVFLFLFRLVLGLLLTGYGDSRWTQNN